MKRYFIIYLHFLRFSLARAMEFRVDFTFRIFMDLSLYIISFIFFKIIYLHTPTLGGLNEQQAMIFVASFIFVDSLEMTFLSNNMWMLPIFVKKGDIDYYLTRPISSRFFLSCRDIAANSSINLVLTTSALVWYLANYPESLPISHYVSYFILLLSGVYLLYLIRMLFLIPVFWSHSSRGLDELFFGLQHTQEKPDAIYQGPIRKILTSILPFAIIISYPVNTLFKGPAPLTLAHIATILIIFSILVSKFWNFALKQYSSASS
jgi:ABC-2 type transport system permease protein